MNIIIVMGTALLEAFHTDWFDDTFNSGAGAGHLVDRGGVRPLRRARSHRTSRLLIIDKSMIKLCMRFQNTLRPLIHFLDILVNVLYSFVWFG